MNQTPDASRIIKASLLSLLIASALLVTVVLPAEYGWDPLGSGSALGLMGLAEERSRPLITQENAWYSDEISFQLMPFESVEYKYRLKQGAALLYRWSADGELLFDMHSEPDGAAPGYAETFSKSSASAQQGNYVAPFAGIHGWFWQNRGQEEVTVTLSSAGFYPWALEFRDGNSFRYRFTDKGKAVAKEQGIAGSTLMYQFDIGRIYRAAYGRETVRFELVEPVQSPPISATFPYRSEKLRDGLFLVVWEDRAFHTTFVVDFNLRRIHASADRGADDFFLGVAEILSVSSAQGAGENQP